MRVVRAVPCPSTMMPAGMGGPFTLANVLECGHIVVMTCRLRAARNRSCSDCARAKFGAPSKLPCRLTSWVNWCPCHGWCL
jgi:hypothetical protein